VRPLSIFAFLVALAAVSAHATVCSAPSGQNSAAHPALPHWRVDHYIYDVSLRQDWEVLVNCDHPEAPARMKLVPHMTWNTAAERVAAIQPSGIPVIIAQPAIKAGAAVEVSNSPGSPASIRLSGTAMQTAYRGQPIRVRLSANGTIVPGIVCGPHSVELAAAAKPSWGKP
jgi:Chaperone for flagella basal body P-ring formation